MSEFFVGLIVGLAVSLVVLVVLLSKNSAQKKENKAEIARLKQMLTDRMELESEGIAKLKSENEELKKMNENLRISLHAFREKPGRRELQRLQIYQTAADRLSLNSPGFAPVWHAALKESEEEFKKTFLGLMPFMKKPVSLKATDANLITDESEENN